MSDPDIYRRIEAIERWIDNQASVERLTPTTGSWTPTFGGTTTNGTIASYTTQVGQYWRIGQMVFASCNLQVNVVTVAPTGTLVVNGLPFTSRNLTNLNAGATIAFHRALTLPAGSIDVTMLVRPNTARAELIASQGGLGAQGLNAASLVSGGGIFGMIIYEAG